MEKEKTQTTHVRIWKTDQLRLKEIRENVGFKSISWVIHRMMQEHVKDIATPDTIMEDKTPTVLTGKRCQAKHTS